MRADKEGLTVVLTTETENTLFREEISSEGRTPERIPVQEIGTKLYIIVTPQNVPPASEHDFRTHLSPRLFTLLLLLSFGKGFIIPLNFWVQMRMGEALKEK